jgi:penicillin-binding protein 2
VVIDPNNGDVLAMVSVPSFDPNTFIPSIKAKDWTALQKDEARPLVNRAISAFPPGSTFKIVTSLAGLRKKMANARFNCSGGVTYGDHYFHCWIGEKGGAHGTLGLTDAIKVSCNAFFYQYGNAAGIDSIDQTGNALGLGKETGIHLSGEQPGIMPGPDWMAIHYPRERWTQAYTANVSIGQGYVLATPLQMAMAYATVANGGISYYPRLVTKILNQDGTIALDENGKPVVSPAPKIDADLRREFTPEQIEMIRRGLWKVVNEDGGTGSVARLENVQVAGKTGTAQATDRGHKDTIAWFACYAPFENPKYVVVAMVQGGEHGGSVAGPIATRILERTFAMDQGRFEPQLAWIAPAHKENPFEMIKAVTFKDSLSTSGAKDEENPGEAQVEKADMAKAGDAPDVEPEADAAGKIANVGRAQRALRAVPAATPPSQRPRNLFERIFGVHPRPAAPTPAPTKRARPAF